MFLANSAHTTAVQTKSYFPISVAFTVIPATLLSSSIPNLT